VISLFDPGNVFLPYLTLGLSFFPNMTHLYILTNIDVKLGHEKTLLPLVHYVTKVFLQDKSCSSVI
jgi:hypothetical protein